MADFNIQPVATQIKPMQGMSLGDMVNMARGVQQYQQAEQVNPLELQIRQQQARTGEIALGVEEQKNKERLNFQTFMSDPKNYMTDGKFDDQKFTSEIGRIMPLTGIPAIKDLTALGQAQSEALRAKHNLTQDKRELVSRTLALAGRAKIDNPEIANEMLDMLVQQNPNDQDLKNLVEKGYKPVLSKMKAGPEFPDFLVKTGQQMLTPSQLETTFEPKITVTPEGRAVSTQKMPGTAEPVTKISVAGGLQAPQPTAEPKNLPYPVRSANQPYIPEPSEPADLQAGLAYRNRLVGAQQLMATNRRNTEEVINQANKIGEQLIFEKGGKPGQIEQKIRSAIGSAEYDILAKSLANLALSNIQAMGGVSNTVAGLDMQQVALGTIKVPPDVLVKIARQVQAEQTNLDMQANGSQKFAEKFGDNNMKRFQQDWNSNADNKIFEVMNIYRDVSDPNKRKFEIDKLLGSDPNKRKEFFEKYQNLKKLSETGGL